MPKITALTALAAADVAASIDVLPIVDSSANATKKITVDALMNAGTNAVAPTSGTLAVTGEITTTGNVGVGTSPTAGVGNRRAQIGGASDGASGLLVKSTNSSLSLYASSTAASYVVSLTGTPLAFGSGPDNLGTFSECFRADAGNLLVGTTSGSYNKIVKSSANDYMLDVVNTSATVPYGQRILLSGVTGGTGGYFLSCQDNAERFRIVGNGDVQNINNSYGGISDAKLKRGVTDTGPKLPKILAMRIVNYYLKADPSNTKLLGMIAQELREISPGLVEENPDYEDVVMEPARTDTVTRQRQKTEARTVTQWKVEVRDGVAVRSPVEVIEHVPLFIELPLVGEDGQQTVDVVDGKLVPAVFRQPVMEDYTETVDVPAKIERRATGTVTLSVKYSVLVPMLVKAMQELHADFDARLRVLEAKA